MAELIKKQYLDEAGLKVYDDGSKQRIAEGDAATLQSAQEYAKQQADSKDAVIAEAKKAGTDAQAAVTALSEGQVATNAQDIVNLKAKDAELVAADEAMASDIKANEDAIAVINGEDTVEGSIKKAVKDAKDALDAKDAEIEGKVNVNTGDITTMKGQIAALEAGTYDDTEVRGLISDNAEAIEALHGKDTELAADIKANTDAIAVLNGSAEGSVKKTVDDAINKFATDVTNDEVVNSYKELIDWVAEHGSEAAEMAAAIEANETAIGELEALVGALPEGVTATTVVALIQELVAAEKTRAEGVEGGLDSRLAAVEQKFIGDESVDAKIATAKQEAIDTAAEDATSKANKALEDANRRTDAEVAKDRTRLEALEKDTHTHTNKAELDKFIDGDKAKLDSALQQDDIATGTANGTISVKGADVAVKGLGSAAYADADDFDQAGASATAKSEAVAHADSLNTAMTTTVNGVASRVGVNETAIAEHASKIEALENVTIEAIPTSSIQALFATTA